MAVTETVFERPSWIAQARARAGQFSWHRLALPAAMGIAALFNIVQLSREAYGNTYYAATVKSMLTSWHNFFFVSFDAGGFVSADKSPLGLWIQAASAKLFGFNGLSLLLPQALAGVAAVAVLYHLVARRYGWVAGFFAALALAVTPISVVTERNNTSDGVLVLVLLCAAWAVSVAAETGRLGPLLLGAALVGFGFNVKMLEAYLVLPALALLWLVGTSLPWRKCLVQLLAAGGVLLVVSLAWVVTVDLTPASARPYVGSSGTNSALSLTLGYNGLSRLTDAFFTRFPGLRLFHIPVDLNVAPAMSPGIGEPGWLRLLNQGLAGQISWLLPFAVVGLIVAAVQAARGPDRAVGKRQWQEVALWGGWLAGVGGFFSVARFFHTYYLIMLAPPIAALVGIGCVVLFRWYREGGWRAAFLPVALLLSAIVQRHILSAYRGWGSWLTPLIVGGCLVAAVALALARLPVRFPVLRAAPVAVVVGMVALLLAPTVWSAVSVRDGNGGAWLPSAGPTIGFFPGGGPRGGFGGPQGGNGPGTVARAPQGQPAPTNGRAASGNGFPAPGGNGAPGFGGTRAAPGGNGGPGFSGGPGFGGVGAMTFAGSQWDSLNPDLVTYLETNQDGARYLVATTTSSYASLFILATDQPALALGGYQGWDRIVTPAQLAQMVQENVVRFFYISGNGGNGGNGGRGSIGGSQDATADLTQWVRTRCTAVPTSAYQTATAQSGGPARGGFAQGNQLYDCASAPSAQSGG